MKREQGCLGKDGVKELGTGAKAMDAGDGIKYMPMCPEDIGKVTSSNAVMSRSFATHNLIGNHTTNLHVRGYMDYYGGYSEHTRNVVYRLQDTGRYNIKVTNIKTPIDVDPMVWQKNNWFVHNQIELAKSNFMVIAGPGWLQEKFLPERRKTIGWTMIESRDFSDECAKWIRNADLLLCPTDIDIRRAKGAGHPNAVKARLGFDHNLYHPEVKPIEMSNIPKDNYVFGVLGSWNIRKGVEEIIRAYCHAFTKKDPVTLLLCCKYGNRKWGVYKDDEERWTIKYEFNRILEEMDVDRSQLPHIALMDIPVHETVLPHVMARFDCIVGFSSGESTWLPGIQAMGMKIPVIQLANDCCGYMEYLNEDNSMLCHATSYEVCSEEFWRTTSEYYEGQVFGYGDYLELSEVMKSTYIDTSVNHATLRIDRAYRESQNWTWDESIKGLDKILKDF